MSNSVWKDSLDCIGNQLDAVFLAFSRGESTDLTHSTQLLELMAKELVDWAAAQRDLGADRRAVAGKLRQLSERLSTLRQTLLQRTAYAESALKLLVPSASGNDMTYANSRHLLGKTPYGSGGPRSSGTMAVVRA
jgi:hypothetical protein